MLIIILAVQAKGIAIKRHIRGINRLVDPFLRNAVKNAKSPALLYAPASSVSKLPQNQKLPSSPNVSA